MLLGNRRTRDLAINRNNGITLLRYGRQVLTINGIVGLRDPAIMLSRSGTRRRAGR